MKNRFVITILIFTFFTSYTFSQDNLKVGLSGSVQSNQFGILIPVWVGEKTVFAPAFDVKFAQDIGSEFSFGFAIRMYIKKDKIAPYIGLKIGAVKYTPSRNNILDNSKSFDILAGIAVGGEYFLANNLSIGVEAQGNLTKSDENSYRFGNPGGINFNTATMIIANIYF